MPDTTEPMPYVLASLAVVWQINTVLFIATGDAWFGVVTAVMAIVHAFEAGHEFGDNS